MLLAMRLWCAAGHSVIIQGDLTKKGVSRTRIVDELGMFTGRSKRRMPRLFFSAA